MNIIEKYTALTINTDTINDTVRVELHYGRIEGPYYNRIHPEEEFDTKEEAIEYAYKKDKYKSWLILPIIRFSIFNE